MSGPAGTGGPPPRRTTPCAGGAAPRSALLTRRCHIDLLRVASAVCRPAR
ncbi:putative leader peptide [Streptomyces sp. NPDC047002]